MGASERKGLLRSEEENVIVPLRESQRHAYRGSSRTPHRDDDGTPVQAVATTWAGARDSTVTRWDSALPRTLPRALQI